MRIYTYVEIYEKAPSLYITFITLEQQQNSIEI